MVEEQRNSILPSTNQKDIHAGKQRYFNLESATLRLGEELIDFYLTQSPYAKSDAPTSRQSICLADFGWSGKSKLARLMNWISLEFMQNDELCLIYSAAEKVNENVSKYGLDRSCISRKPQIALLTISNKINIGEDNQCTCRLHETYITCFLRHIRNSIAHGFYWKSESGTVLFKDTSSKMQTQDEDKKITACIFTTESFLNQLKRVIKDGPETELIENDISRKLNGESYQLRLSKELSIAVKEDGEK